MKIMALNFYTVSQAMLTLNYGILEVHKAKEKDDLLVKAMTRNKRAETLFKLELSPDDVRFDHKLL